MVRGQRTKGNTKASSSSRTAELLATSGASSDAINTFVSFSAVSSNFTEEEDLSMDSDLKVVFKKMSKKDCITKVKALQEFQQLIKEKTEAEVKSMLSQWPRVYTKLANDNDWRVREATHKVQEQLSIKMGRNIAPYLKQLIPIWLTSQFDGYSPAAASAVSSFNTAFPATKKSDVLVFTKEPVLNYIKDILLNQTIESVSELTATAEENKSKYNRLVSNCLQGLTALIISLPMDSLSECEASVQELVNSNKFWKFAKFPDSLIRCSWFRLMSCLAQNIKTLFISNANKICALTLGGLDEKDILVAASVWDCALLCLLTVQDCWSHVNFKKAFNPQFRAILREGGRGNAVALFPNLLPILSRIPHESADDFIRFHKEFYSLLKEGIEKSAKSSQSECNAVIRAFTECLRFSLSSTVIEDMALRVQFQTHLIQIELLSLVKDSIAANDSLSKSSLFNDLALLWLYLKKEDKYRPLIDIISTQLTEICLEKVNQKDYKSFGRISRLFLCLFSDTVAVNKEKKIRFRRESDEDIQNCFKSLKLNQLIADKSATDVLNRITKHLIDCYHSDQHLYQCLQLLVHLLRVQTTETFHSFLNCYSFESLEKFWTNYLKVWFKSQSLSLPSEEKSKQMKTLIDLIIILLALTQEMDRKFNVLDEICSLNDPYIIETLFSTISASNDKLLLKWLKSDGAGEAIVRQTSNLIHNSIDSPTSASSQRDLDILWQLISHCFTENSFNRLYVEKVIEKFRVTLQKSCRSVANKQYLVDFTCRLAKQLFSSYELCTSLSSAKDLLLTIFSLNTRFDDQNNELINAWKSGVINIVKSNGAYVSEDGIITRLALQIRSDLQSNITSLDSAKLVFGCAYELLATIFETINSRQSDEEKTSLLLDPNIAMILELMLLTDTEWTELEAKCDDSVVHYDWLNSDSIVDTNECQIIDNNCFDSNCTPFVFSAVSVALLAEKLILNLSTNELNSDLCQVMASQLSHVFIASTYVSVKSKTSKTIAFKEIQSILNRCLAKIFEFKASNDLNVKIGEILLKKSIDENSLKTQSFGHFMERHIQKSEELEYQFSFENPNYNKLITFQKCCSHLPQTLLSQLLDKSLNAFLCCDRFIQLEDGIAKLAVLQSCLKYLETDSALETIAETVTSIMETFCGLKSSNSDLFYYKNDIEANSELQFYCLIIQTFDVIVGKYADKLSQPHWDLILCSTTSWIINIVRQKENLSNSLPLNIFATKVLKLIQTISETLVERTGTESVAKYPENLLLEWSEFHSKNIFNILIPFYIEICEKRLNFYDEILIKYLSKAVLQFPNSVIGDLLTNFQHKDSLCVQTINKNFDFLYLPNESENCFNILCPLVVNNNLSIALSANQLILKFIPILLKDVVQPEVMDREEEECLLSPPKTLLSLLQQTDNIVDTLLSDFLIGDCCCVVEPNTDSFTYTFGYLLLWLQITNTFANLCGESRSQFSAFLRQSSYLSRLLENLFRLMPLSATEAQTIATDFADTNLSFIAIDEDLNSTHIQRLSCYLYYIILRRMPASVRQWWNNCDRKTSDVVNRYTSSYFSGVLCAQELEAVQRADITQFNNMVVKSRPSAREVVANYTIEEITIELLIQMPANHPLGPVGIDSGKRIGVNNNQWRQWLLQLTTFLTHQNGSILDGLILWKQNIDKRFQGVDECMICFYVLHSSTFQLPKQQCRYCKKRYHSYCLYKWFRTSANSTCPLCRNLF